MKYLKMLGLAAVAAMALMAFAAGSASATTLATSGVAVNSSETIVATLASGTSALLKDSAGTTTDTCTTSEVKGKTTVFTGTPSGPIETLTFGNCTHTTTVLAKGTLSVTNIAGTTNGTVSSANAEVTVVSTAFGISAVCKTGTGTDIGTLTGVKTGKATMDINGKISCGILGSSTWTGTYTVTSPENLGVEA
ncbi:MAG TPA: hypothetical protein VLK37_03435 [Solirubrobacterales bacterium]|nr:hypothetical protein [Solirubrobacterales bacterium]